MVISVLLVFWTLPWASSPAGSTIAGRASGEGQASEVVDVPEGAGRLLELMNREREASGLEPLVARSDVGRIAIEFSRRTAAEGRLWHNEAYFTPETMAELEAAAVGENLALATSIEDAHARLMNSTDHRANILKADFTVVGVAVTRDSTGSFYVTEDFLFPRRETR